jgi:hypothetical protein
MLCPPPLPDDEEDVWVVASVSDDIATAIQTLGVPPTLRFAADGSTIELAVGERTVSGKQEPLLGRTLLISAPIPPGWRPIDDETFVMPSLTCQTSDVMVKFSGAKFVVFLLGVSASPPCITRLLLQVSR